jgi:magnesium transporter
MTTGTELIIARGLAERHPADAARVLERFEPAHAAALLVEWSPLPAAAVLEQMMVDRAAECLARMSAPSARDLLDRLKLDSVAGLLRRAVTATRQAVLSAMKEERREALGRLLSHEEGTAGALMDPLVLDLPQDLEVDAALARVREAFQGALAYVYVVDRAGRLRGVVSLHEMLKAPAQARLAALMRAPVMRLHAADDRSAILAHPGWNEVHALPVVDGDGRFLGVVRYETLRRLYSEGAGRAQAVVPVAVSLGELYWIGLAGLVEGLGNVALRGARGGDSDDGR